MDEELFNQISALKAKNEDLILQVSMLQRQLELLRSEMDQRMQSGSDVNDEQSRTYHIFLRRISDKIRIPVNGMLGMIDVLKPMSTGTETREYLNILEAYNVQLLTTVSDIVDYAAMRSDTIQLRESWIDLSQIFSELSKVYSFKARGKAMTFKIEISTSVPQKVLTDDERLKQLLSNLLDNAFNNTIEGEVTLSVSNLGEIDNKAVLAFKVEDTGKGIVPELSQPLLAALAAEDSSGLLKTPGEGLGLAIIKELSRLFDGEVSFETEINKGTTFWFTAPFYKNYQEIPAGEAAIAPQNLKILLVEDNYLNQRFARATLIKAGHSVDLAENGKIALKKFQENDYDIILMDVQLPIMDGLEATRLIREIEKKSGKRSRIVAVTAYALERDRKSCMEAGMDFFLAKPFKPNQLLNMLQKVMSEF